MMMPRISRLLIAIASCLVLGALALPLWRIRLIAPQYPEGIGMDIHAGTVRGAAENDLENLNTLNHYIGMKAIEPEEITELHVIPWLIAAVAVVGLAAAAAGRRWLAVGWLGLFALLGAVGFWDFHRWEYDYGHDLDLEHAIIKVPGMTYEPPLIGTKQLLNFTATSWPNIGTWLLAAAFVFGLVAVVLASRRQARAAVVCAA